MSVLRRKGSKYLDCRRVVLSPYISIFDILLCPSDFFLFDSCKESVTLIYGDSFDECRSGSDQILASTDSWRCHLYVWWFASRYVPGNGVDTERYYTQTEICKVELWGATNLSYLKFYLAHRILIVLNIPGIWDGFIVATYGRANLACGRSTNIVDLHLQIKAKNGSGSKPKQTENHI